MFHLLLFKEVKVKTTEEYYMQYLPKIKKMASQYPNHLFEDLLQEAYLGVDHAMTKNNHEDMLPANYMLQWVRYYMSEYSKNNARALNIPRYEKESVKVCSTDSIKEGVDLESPDLILEARELWEELGTPGKIWKKMAKGNVFRLKLISDHKDAVRALNDS